MYTFQRVYISIWIIRDYIVLLIAIRSLDGDIKPGGPLGAFREEQAMTRHRVSPSPFLSSSFHTTQLHYTYSHPNLNFLQYIVQILVPHVMWSAQAVRDSERPHLTPSISLAWNPKRVIVQWVGTGTHSHTYLEGGDWSKTENVQTELS